MIQAGLEFPSTKNAPMHLSPEALVISKSAELMLQFLPPNETVMFTLVVQAIGLFQAMNVNLGV